MTDKNNSLLFSSIYYIMFITGLVVLSTGAILPEIIREFDINYEIAGLLLSIQAIGNMFGVISSGFISDFIGRKTALIIGSLCVAVGFIGITFVSSTGTLFVLIFISGCGWGANNVVNSVMNDVTGGSTKYLNRSHTFFAAGALTAPFFVIFAASLGRDWRTVSCVIGLLAVISVIFLAFINVPGRQNVFQSQGQENSGKVRKSFEAFKHIRYYVFLIIGFTYVAVETIMNGWITTYFQDTGILTDVQAKTVLSLIWVSMLIGRFTASVIGNKIKKEYIIIMCASIILVFSLILIQLNSFITVAVCVFMLGLGLSALFPTNLANSAPLVRGSGITTGILLSAGGLGATVGPLVTGAIAKRLSLSASMWASVVFAALLLIMAGINCMFGRKSA